MLTRKELLAYIRERKYAVQASVDGKGRPQAAAIGIAVTPELGLVFDTLKTTRKYRNLVRNPHVALVIGWDATTVQYEGVAEELKGARLRKYKPLYFKAFPAGKEREKWPGIAYFLIKPKWARFSDFTVGKERMEEKSFGSRK